MYACVYRNKCALCVLIVIKMNWFPPSIKSTASIHLNKYQNKNVLLHSMCWIARMNSFQAALDSNICRMTFGACSFFSSLRQEITKGALCYKMEYGCLLSHNRRENATHSCWAAARTAHTHGVALLFPCENVEICRIGCQWFFLISIYTLTCHLLLLSNSHSPVARSFISSHVFMWICVRARTMEPTAAAFSSCIP